MRAGIDPSENGQSLTITCKVPGKHSISNSFIAPYIIGNGEPASMLFRLDANSVFAELRKSVDFPWSGVVVLNGPPTGTRILSGTSFIAAANNSLKKYVSATYEDCPTSTAWPLPFGHGQKCVHWLVNKGISSSEFFGRTPTAPDPHTMGGWMRYVSDVGLLKYQFKPPISIYCADNEEAPDGDSKGGGVGGDGQRVAVGAGGEAVGLGGPKASMACAFSAPAVNIPPQGPLTINLQVRHLPTISP